MTLQKDVSFGEINNNRMVRDQDTGVQRGAGAPVFFGGRGCNSIVRVFLIEITGIV